MMNAIDTRFTLRGIRSVRVRVPGPDYWRGYAEASARDSRRFFFQPGWRTAYPREVESALLRVELAHGELGWGESTTPIAPEVVVTIANGLLADLTVGREFASPAALVDLLYDAQRCRGYVGGYYQDAIAALDIALHDALAKRAGLPLARALTPKPRASVACYLSGARAADRDGRIEALRQWAATGSSAAKLFLRGDLAGDLEEYSALRAAVPQIVWWAVDALWTYDTAEIARHAKREFGAGAARWLECPMLPEDLDGHAALAALPGAPIALGEHFRLHRQVEPWLAQRAVDVIQPDVGRTGFVEGMRILEAARTCGVSMTPHMGASLDVMHAATLHLAACCGADLPCEFQAGLAGRMGHAVRSEWRVAGGAFALPDAPGLGVTVDEAALQALVVT